jgi:hypothetical protein
VDKFSCVTNSLEDSAFDTNTLTTQTHSRNTNTLTNALTRSLSELKAKKKKIAHTHTHTHAHTHTHTHIGITPARVTFYRSSAVLVSQKLNLSHLLGPEHPRSSTPAFSYHPSCTHSMFFYLYPSICTIHYHLPTGRHPIIRILQRGMPKPPQPASPQHIRYALNTQSLSQLHGLLSILECHPAHPSHHHILCPLQSLHILHLHSPCLTAIHDHPLNACFINLSLQI